MEEAQNCGLSARQVLVTGLLFYILLSIVPASQGSSCGHALSQEFNAAENRALGNATIWSGRVGTLVGCVSRCHSWQACKSVNYFKNNRRCDLNNATRVDSPNDFVADYASVYFDGNGDTPGFSVADHSDVHTPGFSVTVEPRYSDCQSLLEAGYSVSGIYTIFPAGFADGLRVYCDMETDGGGWLVIQRRQNGSVDFYRDWADYRVGFGDLAGEFWLGNDNLRTLSSSAGSWDLRVDLQDWDDNTAWAEYGDFQISGQDFRLSFDSYNVQSTAGDSLDRHNGLPFSTMDNDNDKYDDHNCAELMKGAWWYSDCYDSNLNGMYFNSAWEISGDYRVISWKSWRGYLYSLKKCSMKIRLEM
ncbi:microfibril-associated glycoprotein 4-like [Patiria miniata]|uniref:Fibrinogen C-terminal domain-containing protein n=1 Tax=Patiria miniata TaxID=46514 RepID=A0A913ZL05_PATMI|nr:microfibril-associated glycoprotein 4-like [Patiria miniata]